MIIETCTLLKKSNLDTETLTNYRPVVSNLTFLSKLLKHVILARVSPFLQCYKFVDTYQCTYRAYHNIETSLVLKMIFLMPKLMENLLHLLLLTFPLHLTVDHSMLLKRLFSIGFAGTVLKFHMPVYHQTL